MCLPDASRDMQFGPSCGEAFVSADAYGELLWISTGRGGPVGGAADRKNPGGLGLPAFFPALQGGESVVQAVCRGRGRLHAAGACHMPSSPPYHT